MKKIEIHIFPEKTADKKFFRISVPRIICFIAAVIISITGFILFNPLEIFRLVSDKQVLRVYQENKFLKEEIQKTKNNLELAKQELAVTDSLKDSLFHDKAIQHISNSQLKEFFPLQVASYNIPNLTKHRKILLTSLQANKQIAKSLPLVMPLKDSYTITNRYQTLFDPFIEQNLPHRGIDFVPTENDTIFAPGGGMVSEIREHRGFGLTLKLEHTEHIRTFYAHLQKTLVTTGSQVKRGMPIAIVGNSGRSPGKTLHYEIRYDGNAINPEHYILYPIKMD